MTSADELTMLRKHLNGLPILIDAVRRLPDAAKVLADWDKARK